MKKRTTLLICFCFILLCICGCKKANITRKISNEKVPDRIYNNNMTLEEIEEYTYFVADSSFALSDAFNEFVTITDKYSDVINESNTFDWSQYWEFRDLKEKVVEKCDVILEKDCTKYSKEINRSSDEFKAVATSVKKFFECINKEMPVNEITALFNTLENDVNIGLNNAKVYMTLADIVYLEDNGGDEKVIESFYQQIRNSYIYRDIYGDSPDVYRLNKYNTIFTNSFGEKDTKCIVSGCSNPIASSGDTNCCRIHSNKCFSCGIYIDGDALFCLNCLRGDAIYTTSNPKKDVYKSTGQSCSYKYLDGGVCGKPCNKYDGLCDNHFKQLNDVYMSLVGQ